ncbi:uncharacterized protein CBL_13471 [Carabus blaptoides fortunei]
MRVFGGRHGERVVPRSPGLASGTLRQCQNGASLAQLATRITTQPTAAATVAVRELAVQEVEPHVLQLSEHTGTFRRPEKINGRSRKRQRLFWGLLALLQVAIAQTTDYDSTTQDSNNPEQYETTMTVNLTTHEGTADSDIRTSTTSVEKIRQLNTVNSGLNLTEREYDLNEKNITETGESGLDSDIKIIDITDDSVHNHQLSSNDNSNIEQLSMFTLNNDSTYLTYTDLNTEQTYTTTTISETTSHSESTEIETAQNKTETKSLTNKNSTAYLDINGNVHVLNVPLEHEPKLDKHIRNGAEENIMLKAQHHLKQNVNGTISSQHVNVNINNETRTSVQSSLHGLMRNISKKEDEKSSVEMDYDVLPTASSYSDLDKMEHRLSQDSLFLNSKDKTESNGFDTPEPREVEEAADYGLRMMNELIRVKEPELYRMGLWLERDDPAGKVASFNAPNPQALRLARYGYASLQASTKLIQQLSTSESLLESRISPLHLPPELRDSLKGTALHDECPLRGPIPCRPAAKRYRTADGTCNNRKHPKRGSALTPQQRFLPPRYDDGLQTIRRSVVNRSPLPSAREVSTRIHRDRHLEAPSITLMLMQWGQFVDHDITATPQSRAFNGSTPRCCADGGRAFQPSEFMHPECLPISVPSDDWFLERFNVRCFEFVRSAPAPREDCDFGHRQQMNQVTSYIDASTIYGSSSLQADSIRLFRGGMVQYGRLDNRNPPDPPGGELCRKGAITSQCFRSGDNRAPEQPALTAIHITWIREHNILARKLSELNQQWSDEKVYQETRRIVGAMIQHITYREFLPIILGHEVMKLFDLQLLPKGYNNGYDPNVNPSPANAFTAAAYRFGHSLVQNSFVRSDRFHRPLFNNVSLHDEQSNPGNIWSSGSVDRLLLGMCNQPSQKRDEFISDELTNHLFQSPGFPFGMDLAAINVQRGRDHGIPPYTAWRGPCGLSPVRNWTDLHRVMSPETAQRFRSLYISVEDIDLYSAGLAERPVRGGLIGPTFACIIAQQFSNLKKGDRFWYENGDFESSFTLGQLQQIRQITFAQIICETMVEVDTIQPFVFLSPDNFQNEREKCRNLINFDITPWREILITEEDSDTFNKAEFDDGNSLENGRQGIKINLHRNRLKRTKRNDMTLTNQQNTGNETDDERKINETAHLTKTNDVQLDRTLQSKNQHTRLTDETTTTPHNDNDYNYYSDITNDSNANIQTRFGRKRKRQPSRRKAKPKPNSNKNSTSPIITKITIAETTTQKSIKANKTRTEMKQISYFGTNKFTVNTIPDPSGYRPYYQTQSPYQNYFDYVTNGRPPNSDHMTLVTKRPLENPVTYLINTVHKTTTTTTAKPDYQLNIQINYFYNTTTERYDYTRPTKAMRPNQNRPNDNFDYRPNEYDRPGHDFDYDRPDHKPDYNSQTYNYNRPTGRPTNQNHYNVHDYAQNPTYNGQNIYPYNDHRPPAGYDNDYGHNNRFTTKRPPSLVTSNPIAVIDIKPQSMIRPQSLPTNRPPTIYIFNHNDGANHNNKPDNFNGYSTMTDNNYYQKPNTPTYDYGYNRPQTYDQNRPNYGTRPETVIYKRPITGHITKLDSKPFVVVSELAQPNYNTDRHSSYNRHDTPYNNINDKLDFTSSKKYVKIMSTKKNIYTTAKYSDDDRRFVKLSTVKGHKTSTDSLNPVYVNVQQKEAEDDLEMTYDDLLEVYVKPDKDFVRSHQATSKDRNDDWNTTNDTHTIPLPKPTDNDLCSTELPKPMNLFIDEDLLEL